MMRLLALAALLCLPAAAPIAAPSAVQAVAPEGTPCAVRSGDGAYPNPVMECSVADPGVVVQGDTWHVFSTGLKLHKTTDAGHTWEALGSFVDVPDGYVDAWAPEVYQIGGQWIAYFSMRPGPGEFANLYVATSNDLEQGWTFHEEPLWSNPDRSSIDVTMFVDPPTGQRYAVFKEINPHRIMIDKLSEDGLSVEGNPVNILNATLPWEGNSVEAPTMIYRHGAYYLLYSGNLYTWNGHYAVGVARADSPTANFDAGKRGDPILHEDEHFWSPGHQFLTTVEIGGVPREMLFYHAYAKYDPNGDPWPEAQPRQLMMDRLTWGDDGWPRVHDGTPST